MQHPTFVYDTTGKITGYKTQAGADTVFPFNSIDNLVSVFEDGAMYLRSGTNINTPNLNNYKKIIVAIAGNWSDYAYGSDVKITDIDIFKKTPITISHNEGTVSITYISNTSIKVVTGVRIAPCILLV